MGRRMLQHSCYLNIKGNIYIYILFIPIPAPPKGCLLTKHHMISGSINHQFLGGAGIICVVHNSFATKG